MLGFIATLAISLIIAYLGNKIVKNTMPGGQWVTFLIAALGAWLGGYGPIFRGFGPVFDKVNLFPSVILSVILVFLYGFFRKNISEAKV